MVFNAKVSFLEDIQQIEVNNLDAAFKRVCSILIDDGDNAHIWSESGKYVHVVTRKRGESNPISPGFSFNNYSTEQLQH